MEIYCSYIRHNWFAIEWKVNFHQTLADLKRFLHIFTWNGRQKRHETTIYEFERLYSYCEERGVELNADKKTIDNYQRWRARKKFIKKQRKNDQLEIALWTDSQDHQLKPYQKIGVNTVMAARRFILADQVGVGKTPQAIGVMLKAWEEYNGDCALLVCPNRIKGQWKKELLAFTKLKEDDITIFDLPTVCDKDPKPRWNTKECRVCGRFAECQANRDANKRRKRQIAEAKVLICHYEGLRLNEADIIKRQFDVVVFDEASFLKNYQSKVSKSAVRLCHSLPPWGIVLPMSGTIIENRIEEIYPIVSMVDDAALGPFPSFKSRYLILDYWGNVVSIRNEDELRKKLNSALIRRTIDDVWKERPPLVEMTRECTLLPYQAKVYEEARNNVLQSIKDAEKAAQVNNAMLATMMSYLLQICDTVKAIDETCDRKDHSAKLELMIDILEEEIGGEDKVLIFSRFANRVVPHIISTLKKYDKGGVVSITGKVPPAESNAIMQHFKDSNKARFLVCSDALAYGANLQVARHVINFDLPWNPARLDQRIARVYRRGQTKPVNVFNFIVPGTIEEHLYAMLAAKRGLAAKFLKQAKRTGGDINLKALAKLI